mgnify:CR=1 FL=1
MTRAGAEQEGLGAASAGRAHRTLAATEEVLVPGAVALLRAGAFSVAYPGEFLACRGLVHRGACGALARPVAAGRMAVSPTRSAPLPGCADPARGRVTFRALSGRLLCRCGFGTGRSGVALGVAMRESGEDFRDYCVSAFDAN